MQKGDGLDASLADGDRDCLDASTRIVSADCNTRKAARGYDGKNWTDCGQLGDNTQTYSFAVYHGRLYAGTGPSGRVFRFEEVGRWNNVAREHDVPTGWHHVAAVKRTGQLELFLDGKRVAVSALFEPGDYDLKSENSLRIGAGTANFYRGRLRDVRLYQRSLNEMEILALARF